MIEKHIQQINNTNSMMMEEDSESESESSSGDYLSGHTRIQHCFVTPSFGVQSEWGLQWSEKQCYPHAPEHRRYFAVPEAKKRSLLLVDQE